MEWLRWYHGAVSDDKWPLIARKSGQTVAVVIAVWAALLECASQSEVRGSVHDFDPESIDALMQLPDGATQAVVDALSAGMRPRIMDGKIANWSKRQPVRERDDDKSTERVRQHRERQMALQNKDNVPGNADETPVKRQETPRTEKIREEKIREEKKEKNTKTPCQVFAEDSDAYRLAAFMLETLKANVPTLKEPNLQRWAADFDVALRNDQRMKDVRFVAQVIKWACSDDFWRANIQCPSKLRDKFDQLTAKMEAEAAKARTAPQQAAWKAPAQRRLEANQQAGREAKRLLFGDQATQQEVTHEA